MWLTWYRKTKNNKLLWIILDFRTVILCGETHNPLIPKCSQKTKCIRVNSRILEFSDFNFVVQNVRVLEDYARLSKYFFFHTTCCKRGNCLYFFFYFNYGDVAFYLQSYISALILYLFCWTLCHIYFEF